MAKYRNALPQLNGNWFVTDGGIETTLVFHRGIDLPEFASFPLLGDEAGRETLRSCVRPYLDLSRKHGAGTIIETQTWRASRDWARKLGISATPTAPIENSKSRRPKPTTLNRSASFATPKSISSPR